MLIIRLIEFCVLFPNKDMSRCPAIILAVRRTANEPGRIIFLVVSISTMNGINITGVPVGRRCENILFVLLIHPYSIRDIHIGRVKVIGKIRWDDAVKI